MRQVILVRYGEIHLKGLNRPYFTKKLNEAMQTRLLPFGAEVERGEGRYYITGYAPAMQEQILKKLQRIFGIHALSPALRTEKDWKAICEAAFVCVRESVGKTFKVRARRSDKRFFMDSNGICRELGAAILNAFPALSVDVHAPDFYVDVEIREYAYIYTRTLPGAGGMPFATSGRVALLLSGGIDSPVAGHMMLKRGAELIAIHFESPPHTSARSREKVIELARVLADYSNTIALYCVPFTQIQMELYKKCPNAELTVLMRRYMMRLAERIALRCHASALVTGESIGQVASQTLCSLAATDAVVTHMPVFRPLIGFDKNDIIEKAIGIGTYDISILPYEDCCTVFVPRHPVTRPRIERLLESEKLINGEDLMNQAFYGTQRYLVFPDGSVQQNLAFKEEE